MQKYRKRSFNVNELDEELIPLIQLDSFIIYQSVFTNMIINPEQQPSKRQPKKLIIPLSSNNINVDIIIKYFHFCET